MCPRDKTPSQVCVRHRAACPPRTAHRHRRTGKRKVVHPSDCEAADAPTQAEGLRAEAHRTGLHGAEENGIEDQAVARRTAHRHPQSADHHPSQAREACRHVHP
ncbi:MAG: hypothetical protein IKW37_04415 [Bacteroidaceae bacterium]|nr:hypothetical protein [Bacteroidaceae bacterium]